MACADAAPGSRSVAIVARTRRVDLLVDIVEVFQIVSFRVAHFQRT